MQALRVCTFAAVALTTLAVDAAQPGSKPQPVDLCHLQADPPASNHKLVDVSGLVSHAFEEFTLSDFRCDKDFGFWLEYGGTVNSDTIYCCGTGAKAPRGKILVVEGVALPLVDDAMFRQFDDRIRKNHSVKFRATLRGHFFAGEKGGWGNSDDRWGGYGHLGCCSLLVIEQVMALDKQ